ncbi:3-oxoacyl-ACP synthase III family protein [Cyclonatronum proteinivorum]|nr:ketoacyl-ACP synthase III [Cyclonatronum proteinivorum]
MRNARIIGSGMAVPDQIVPNSWFNERLGEDVDTWLQENLTIRERRWMREGELLSDLCITATERALEMAGLKPEQVDLLIISTDTPEFISPSTASVVAYKAGLKNAASFDLNTACAGFVTATETAVNFIKGDPRYRYAVVIGAYGMSRFLNLDDKKTVTLFADGAAAAVLESCDGTENGGHLAGDMRTRGEYNDYMGIYQGGSAHPVTPQSVAAQEHKLIFAKKFPKELNPIMWTDMIRTVAERGGFAVSDIKQAFMTQININQIWETMDNLGLPRETAPAIMSTYGYTGSAAIGMVMDHSIRGGGLQKGDIFVMMGSGGGLTFACNAFRY